MTLQKHKNNLHDKFRELINCFNGNFLSDFVSDKKLKTCSSENCIRKSQMKDLNECFDKDRKIRLYKKFEELLFSHSKHLYYNWRFLKRFVKSVDGCIIGMTDGFGTGMACGCKWAGAGGWISAAVAQLIGTITGTISATVIGFIYGARTDIDSVLDYWKDYRESIGNGAENTFHITNPSYGTEPSAIPGTTKSSHSRY